MTQKRMLKFVPQAFFRYNTVREIERTKTKPTYTYSPSREQCARVTPHRSTTVGVIPWSSQHSVWNLQKSTRSQKIPTKLSFGAIFFVDLISVRFLLAHFPSHCVSIAAVATFLHAGHQREGVLNRNRQPANRIPRGRIYRALPFLPTAGWTIPPVQWKEYHRVAKPFGKVILDDQKKITTCAHPPMHTLAQMPIGSSSIGVWILAFLENGTGGPASGWFHGENQLFSPERRQTTPQNR